MDIDAVEEGAGDAVAVALDVGGTAPAFAWVHCHFAFRQYRWFVAQSAPLYSEEELSGRSEEHRRDDPEAPP